MSSAFEIRFDRHKMYELIENYFATLNGLERKDVSDTRAKLVEFYTEDYISRIGDWPKIRNREYMVQLMQHQLPNLKIKYYVTEPDGFYFADNRNGMAMVHARVEYFNKVTGEVEMANYQNIHLRIVECEDGKYRFDREIRTMIPALFAIDHLSAGKEGQPCWLYNEKDLPHICVETDLVSKEVN